MTEDLAKILLSYIPGWDQYKVIQREMSRYYLRGRELDR